MGLGLMMSWMLPALAGTLMPGICTPGCLGGGRLITGLLS